MYFSEKADKLYKNIFRIEMIAMHILPTKKSSHLRAKNEADMTQGSILHHIITFAFPLMIGNLFQQLYNTVDTWVVGNYVNNDAYSAVGAVAPVVNMLIGAFSGLASGAGVVISQYYGAKQYDNVNKSVHTSILLTFLLAVVFTAVGILMIPLMLQIVNLQQQATKEATTYLTVYFSGLIGLMLYNMGAAILRAVGDSKRPFYFLVVCAIINTILDLLFVLKFNMGVFGVALATIIAQTVSALLVIITLIRSDSVIQLRFKKMHLHKNLCLKILTIGTPAALQLGITSFSNVFVQSYITHFDIGQLSPDYMSGWTSYLKIDQLLFLPVQSIALAVSTFVGQNLGKGDVQRAKKGIHYATGLSLVATCILMIPILIFAKDIVRFLNPKPEVVTYGAMFLHWLTPFYLLTSFNQIYASALRGAGNSKAPMIIMLASFVGFRQIYLFTMSKVYNHVIPIALGYPAGWLLCSLITAIYFYKTDLSKTRFVED